MSFVNAAHQAVDEYEKNNPPSGRNNNGQRSFNGQGLYSGDPFKERTSGLQVTPEIARELEILAAARNAEKIFSADQYPYDWRSNPNDWRVKLAGAAKAGFNSVVETVGDIVPDATSSQNGSSAQGIIYSDWSPAASYFGMDQTTAYAEHMANTAHQREVADLKAAGLNPVLGISGSGASGVSGSMTSGASSAEKGISSDVLVDLFGATASVITMLVSKNPSLGHAVGKVAQAGGNLLFGD